MPVPFAGNRRFAAAVSQLGNLNSSGDLTLPAANVTRPAIRCREIAEADRLPVAELLARGFRCEPAFWQGALAHLARHDTPEGLPRYGYALEVSGTLVGALLLIFARIEEQGAARIQCSLSSWYVEPAWRSYAAMLAARALSHKGVTYVNLTPAPQTVPILKAQGYRELSTGRFVAFPLLARPKRGARVLRVREDDTGAIAGLSDYETKLLRAHAAFGCLSYACQWNGRTYPFVFSPRRWHGIRGKALLVYCSGFDDLGLCAGALGRALAGDGIVAISVQTQGALKSIPGFFRHTTPTFYVGAAPPRPGNLAWSECAMFGV